MSENTVPHPLDILAPLRLMQKERGLDWSARAIAEQAADEIERLRVALGFYANRDNYNQRYDGPLGPLPCPIIMDCGQRARDAYQQRAAQRPTSWSGYETRVTVGEERQGADNIASVTAGVRGRQNFEPCSTAFAWLPAAKCLCTASLKLRTDVPGAGSS